MLLIAGDKMNNRESIQAVKIEKNKNHQDMMDWRSHFHDIFFETWRKNGLPYHPDFLNEYIDIREHGDFSHDWIQKLQDISPGINSTQLRSVYGFGVTIGKIFADMFGLSTEEAKRTTDWCGRFNLGISLFDYICDEMDGVSSVNSLEVFKPFMNSGHTVNQSLTPAEELLSNLAGTVLYDIKSITSNKSNQLFIAMKQMFEAENFISKENIAGNTDLKKIEKALFYKSAEPFKVMAEFTVLAAEVNDETLIKNAVSTGKALGYCYWLIDDAKDVWDDLKSGRWNLFLTIAAKKETQIFSTDHDADMKNRLVKIWEQSNHAEKISGQTIKRLLKAVKVMELPEKIERHTLGLVWASLWQWSKY